MQYLFENFFAKMREFVKNTKLAVIPKAKMKGARANLFAPILKTAARARKKQIRKILRIRFFVLNFFRFVLRYFQRRTV